MSTVLTFALQVINKQNLFLGSGRYAYNIRDLIFSSCVKSLQ